MAEQGTPQIAYGLQGVVIDDTRICKIDGGIGKLYYYGYSIEDLAEHCSYEEVVYLLLKGKLPNEAELKQIRKELVAARGLPYGVRDVIKSAPKTSVPMDVLRTAASTLALTDPSPNDNTDEGRYQKAIRLVAQFPEIVAADYRLRRGHEPIAPDPELDHASNFLYMLHGERPGADAARTMDCALVLHAEHGFNASTFTARVIAATLSDMYSAVTGAVGALKGPLHGGANEAAMEMLKEVGTLENVRPFMDNAFATKRKIMGFGHRVYKHGDHRAPILRQWGLNLTKERPQFKGWFDIGDAVQKIMLDEKKIHPNVDFPCGLTYFTMGIPVPQYTPIFVASRITGWCAHIMEQHADNRLIRPLSVYTGPAKRSWNG